MSFLEIVNANLGDVNSLELARGNASIRHVLQDGVASQPFA